MKRVGDRQDPIWKTFIESKKPDFLDFDKDGNKEEPMEDALKDKKKGKDIEHN
jgi:hypothetical protein